MLTMNQTGRDSILGLPARRRVALGTNIALTVALGLAGTGTLLALNTAQHHQVAAISRGSQPMAVEASLTLNSVAR